MLGHLVKDCSKGLEFASDYGEIPVDKLAYGDKLRASNINQQSNYVAGSAFHIPTRSDGDWNIHKQGNTNPSSPELSQGVSV